jgi:multiple sugar transport system ATP-binding protein
MKRRYGRGLREERMASIVLEGVSKRFGAVDVIRDLSLEVRAGEFMVLVGPSGCGKSTLLRMIAGLESVSAGTIRIDGRPVERLAPGARGVAMVFQSYALYPHMSVRENMSFGLRNVGLPARDIARRVADAAARLQIDHLLERKPGQLSGGQRQRVAIGRAIVKKPKAFLFDEPLSNLDAALRAGTRIELAKLHQAVGATMVFVTHDQVEAMTLATRIAILNEGRIEQIGTPLEIYRRPASRFVAGFIGSPAMNFLDVRLTPAADGRLIMELPGGVRLPTDIASQGTPAGSATLGVRPEHVRPDPEGAVRATAEVVERLGPRTLVYTTLPDGRALTYEDAGESPVAVGESVRLAFDAGALHLFAPNGAAITPPQPGVA